jgi:enamine deaminase RidA (YjgF/YER057c/UK114 family)
MAGKIDKRLKDLGIELPVATTPVANYVPFVVSGSLLFIAGQIPLVNGELRHVGKLGAGISVEDGQKAARVCALNLLAQAKVACGGDLDRIRRCVKVTGYVNCTPDFVDIPSVINGASDLFVEVLGDSGRHARVAIGTGSLPRGVATEVDAIFEIA